MAMMAELAAQKDESFRNGKDSHYRQQLLGVQLSTTIVSEAKVHGPQRLPDEPEVIDELVLETYGKTGLRSPLTEAPMRAAMIYAKFANEVNGAMEQRDVELVVHKVSKRTCWLAPVEAPKRVEKLIVAVDI